MRARGRFAASLALVLAVLAAGGVAFLWRQHRVVDVALHDAQIELEDSLERTRAAQRALSDRLDDLGAELASSRAGDDRIADRLADLPARLDDLERRLDGLPGRVAELGRRVAEAQGVSPDARATWLRAEAEYYLAVANAELELAGRWDNAETALELADGRLRELADPSLAAVRKQIAADLLALESVEQPDIERIVFDLASLESRVDALPLRSPGSAGARDGAASDEAEPGLGRLAASAKRALRSLVTIERRETSEARALSAGRRAVARRELGSELSLARAAALQERPRAYAASLGAAAQLLERDFDRADPGVRAAAERVAELAATDVAPPRPDIGRSLTLLRAARAEAD